MSKKRRVFDIDFELDDGQALERKPTDPAETTRRGPMATAISEAADASADRMAAENLIRKENDALAHEYVDLKRQGLVTSRVPTSKIKTKKLIRDRAGERDEEIGELKSSIREIGLSNPIRVEMVDGQYELIQGFRRLTAFRELADDLPNGGFDTIPAVINARGESNLVLYRRMVDENIVRRDVTFGELAVLAQEYKKMNPAMIAVDQAVDELFQSASRQKRSHIRTFVRLLSLIDLNHVAAVSRNMGTALLKKLEETNGQVSKPKERLKNLLSKHPYRSAEEEQAILQSFLDLKPTLQKPAVSSTGKTTFRVSSPMGVAKCTASDGRLELRLNHDFSGVQREVLENVVTEMLAKLK